MTAPFDDLIRAALDDPDRRRRLAEVAQSGLVARGYDLGSSGPARDGVDGVPGPLTLAALAEALSPPVVEGEPWDDLDRLDAALAAVAPTLHDSERTEWVAYLSTAAARWGINTPARLAMWLAQLGHESAGFTRFAENLNYSAAALRKHWPHRVSAEEAPRIARKPELIANRIYGGRMGNTEPGDGWEYRGRGPGMLTGAENYREGAIAIGVPIDKHPGLLLVPAHGTAAAAWYWARHGCNRHADRGDLRANTLAWNGGTIGLEHRGELWAAAKAALGVTA